MFGRQFYQIAVGLVFVAVDIRLEDIDLLVPDFIGYLLICLAAAWLRTYSSEFGVPAALAAVATVLSLPDLIKFDSGYIFGALFLLVDLLMIWTLCSGIMSLAAASGNAGLSAAASSRRALFLVFAIVNVIAAAVAPVLGLRIPALFATVLFTASLAARLAVILLMRRAAIELTPAPAGAEPRSHPA